MPDLKTLLTLPKTIAIVGLSDKADRPSFVVASYLQAQGFKIIPVNPRVAEILGEKSYANIRAIPAEIQVDIVDIFRRSDAVIDIVTEVIESGRKPLIWLQEGVTNPAAKEIAEATGLVVFMDVCLMKAHQSLLRNLKIN